MPSVASETSAFHPPRLSVHGKHGPADASAKDRSTPFAELLDSATPPAEPQRESRADRPDRTDSTPKAERRTADRSAPARDTKPASDNRNEKDMQDAAPSATDGSTDAPPEGDARVAVVKDGEALEGETAAPDGDAASAGDSAPASDAVLADAVPPPPLPQPVAAPQPVALPAEAAPDAPAADDQALAALQAAAAPTEPAPARPELKEPVPAQAEPAKPATADAAAKSDATPKAPAAELRAAVHPTETGKDDSPRQDGEHAQREFGHAAAETIKALHADESAPKIADAFAPKGAHDVQNAAAAAASTATPPAAHASNAAPAQTQPQAPVVVPLAGVAVEIVSQAHAGKNRFEIRLDPPELGRIDVRLDMDRDGNVSTRLVVDRTETLDLLRRDASQLERALQQAGLKTSDNGLQFSLRQESFAQNDQAQDGSAARITVTDDDAAPLEALRQGYGRLLGLGGGLDIRV